MNVTDIVLVSHGNLLIVGKLDHWQEGRLMVTQPRMLVPHEQGKAMSFSFERFVANPHYISFPSSVIVQDVDDPDFTKAYLESVTGLTLVGGGKH